MTLDSSHPNFRYPNDNRLANVGVNIYPSQGMPDPTGTPGFGGYYPNDNSGHYPNSNRQRAVVDTIKHPPNANWPTGGKTFD